MKSVLAKLVVFAVAAIDRRADAFSSLAGVTARSVESGDDIDLGEFLSASSPGGDKSMLILGTYAADFNAIEYGQRLRYYLPELKKRGITKVGFVREYLRLCVSASPSTLTRIIETIQSIAKKTRQGSSVTCLIWRMILLR